MEFLWKKKYDQLKMLKIKISRRVENPSNAPLERFFDAQTDTLCIHHRYGTGSMFERNSICVNTHHVRDEEDYHRKSSSQVVNSRNSHTRRSRDRDSHRSSYSVNAGPSTSASRRRRSSSSGSSQDRSRTHSRSKVRHNQRTENLRQNRSRSRSRSAERGHNRRSRSSRSHSRPAPYRDHRESSRKSPSSRRRSRSLTPLKPGEYRPGKRRRLPLEVLPTAMPKQQQPRSLQLHPSAVLPPATVAAMYHSQMAALQPQPGPPMPYFMPPAGLPYSIEGYPYMPPRPIVHPGMHPYVYPPHHVMGRGGGRGYNRQQVRRIPPRPLGIQDMAQSTAATSSTTLANATTTSAVSSNRTPPSNGAELKTETKMKL